jgi:hypothetical protein
MARQYPLKNWHYMTPYPASGPMSRAKRDWWLDLVMKGSHYTAGPKAEMLRVHSPKQRAREAANNV